MNHTNVERANRLYPALEAYLKALEGRPAFPGEVTNEDTVKDLLADLMHFCDQNGINFIENLEVAADNYNAEVLEEE